MPLFSLHRFFITGLATLGLCTALSTQAQETVRIGYQKSSTLITLLKTGAWRARLLMD